VENPATFGGCLDGQGRPDHPIRLSAHVACEHASFNTSEISVPSAVCHRGSKRGHNDSLPPAPTCLRNLIRTAWSLRRRLAKPRKSWTVFTAASGGHIIRSAHERPTRQQPKCSSGERSSLRPATVPVLCPPPSLRLILCDVDCDVALP
jgi:hypothetical protein